ncbi:MAG: AMP-binding protein [Aureliella sp.]
MIQSTIVNDSLILQNRMQETASVHPDKTACTFLQNGHVSDELTFGQLDQRAKTIAASLLQYANPGERAILSFHPGLEFIEAFLGCLYAGVVAVPAYTPKRNRNDHRLTAILRDCNPKAVLCKSETLNDLKSSICCLPAECDLLAVDQMSQSGFFEPQNVQQTDIAFLQYTSGSTSAPKGVVVSQRNLVANQELMSKHWGFTQESLMVSWLPMFHDMGLIAGILAPLFGGFETVLMAPNDFLRNPVTWLQALSDYRATVTGAPNFAWELCARRITDEEKNRLDLSHLKIASSGGETVRASTVENFSQQFKRCGFRADAFAPSYGMAESTLLISGVTFGKVPNILRVDSKTLEKGKIELAEQGTPIVSCGKVGPGTTAKIVDPNAACECSENEIGEVWLHGDSIAGGYFGKDSETKGCFQAKLHGDSRNWLRTGDLGFFRDGEVYLTGRLKDVLIINGRNIYPQDIELLVEQQFDFVGPNSVAAFAASADSENVVVVIEGTRDIVASVRREGESSDKLRKLLSQLNALSRTIRQTHDVVISEFVIVRPAAFPRTSSGKVQRRLAQRMYQDESHKQVTTWSQLRKLDKQVESTKSSAQPQSYSKPLATNTDDQWGSINGWLKDFASTHNAFQADARKQFSARTLLDLGNRGLLGMFIPETYGGLGLSKTTAMKVFEQTAAIDLSLSVFLGIHNGLGVTPIVQHGSPTLKDQFLPEIAQGRCLVSFAVSESGSASNPLGIKTTARHGEHGWEINGAKQWIGNADWAKLFVVFAKQLDENGLNNGSNAFVVRRDNPGLHVGPETNKLGMRGFVQNSVDFRSAYVSHDSLLGNAGDGFSIVSQAMTLGRLGITAQSAGVMKRCAQLMHRFASSRMIATGLLMEHPVTLVTFDELLAGIDCLETAYSSVAHMLDANKTVPGAISAALKVCGSNAAWKATDSLVQCLGARGYMEPNGAARMLRDARVLRIGEGTSEALLSFIGSTALHTDEIPEFLANDLNVTQAAEELRKAKETAQELGCTPSEALHAQSLLGDVCCWLIMKALNRKSALESLQWIESNLAAAVERLHDLKRRHLGTPAIHARLAEIDKQIGDVPVLASNSDLQVNLQFDSQLQKDFDSRSKSLGTANATRGANFQISSSSPEVAICREVCSTVRAHLSANSGHDDRFDHLESRSFAELGIDSLESQALLANLEKRFEIKLGDDALFEYSTPTQLSNLIYRLQTVAKPGAVTGYWVRVVDSKHELFARARDAVREAMSKVYLGWNDELDRRYDDAAVFFVAGNSCDEIVATSRIYLPSLIDGKDCPLANADQNPFRGFGARLDMEGGGLMMKDSFSAKLVMKAASSWIADKGLGSVFMAYDVRNRFIENLYLEGLGLEKIDHPLLAFDSFCHRDTLKPVQWQMVVRRGGEQAKGRWATDGFEIDIQDLTSL